MDGRGFGSGFSSWGGGLGSSSRGSSNYDFGDYGGGAMKRGMSGGSFLSTGADAVIAKINQRLDMLTQLEGGMKGGGRGDRFDQLESFDSRSSSLGPRDLYRSGNFYGDSRGDMMSQRGGMGFGAMGDGGGAGGFDGSAKMRRDAFSDSGWGAGQMSQHRGGRPGGHGFGRRQDPSMLGGAGGQGLSPSGLGALPSLLSHRLYPERRGFQPQQRSQFGNRRDNRQRNRKKALNRQQQQVRPQPEGQKKRKQSLTPADEPQSKVGRTETSRDDNKGTAEEEKKNDDAGSETESKAEAEAQTSGSADKEDGTQSNTKPKAPLSDFRDKKKRGYFERVMFACSICKYRSFYSEDMEAHLKSKFHKDHIKFLSNQLTKPTTDFLQEYLSDKYKKMNQRVKNLENHSAVICQTIKEQDLTRDLTLDHFMKKVEAAHCAACDMYIPMQPTLIQKHVKSPDHNFNRRGMMEQSKRSCLSVARSILNHKDIGKKLQSFLKGNNPFLQKQAVHNPEDPEAVAGTEGEGEPKPEEEEPAGGEAPEAVGDGEEEKEQAEEHEEAEGEGAAPLGKDKGAKLNKEDAVMQEEANKQEGAEVQEGDGKKADEDEDAEVQEQDGVEVDEGEGEEEDLEMGDEEGVEMGDEECEDLGDTIPLE